MDCRIHVFGASGSGTTTLGAPISARLGIPHFDTDDYYWVKTDIPFTVKREIPERTARLEPQLRATCDWALSGSLMGWGDFAIPLFTQAIYLRIPGEVRMQRLKARELRRYGEEALAPGGWFHRNHLDFMAWAATYDAGGAEGRSRQRHERWMAALPCPLLRFEEPLPVEEMVRRVVSVLDTGK